MNLTPQVRFSKEFKTPTQDFQRDFSPSNNLPSNLTLIKVENAYEKLPYN